MLYNARSHYCIFGVHLRQTAASPQGDRKFPIFALISPLQEKQTTVSSVNQPLPMV